eukprot:4908738-Amphidinium_carterae.1
MEWQQLEEDCPRCWRMSFVMRPELWNILRAARSSKSREASCGFSESSRVTERAGAVNRGTVGWL